MTHEPDRTPPTPTRPDPVSDWIPEADAHDLRTFRGRLRAFGRSLYPVEPRLDAEAVAASDRRWTDVVILVVAAFMLTFNAVSPLNWSREQPPGWWSVTVGRVSEVWVDQLAQVGTDMPRQGMRDIWHSWQDARFPGQEPAEPRPPT